MADERITPQSKATAHIHYVMAFTGGMLGLFPMFNVVKMFGSAQTSNLIECVLNAFGNDWSAVFMHLGGAGLYALAVFLVTFLPAHTKINIQITSLFVDVAAAVVMALMPSDLPAVVYFYPTFFAMSFQWSSFGGAYGYVSSTIFSTNNLKQFVSSLTEAFCNGKPEFKLKAVFFGATLLSFHLGVGFSYILHCYFENRGFLFAAVPCLAALILIIRKIRKF